MAARYGNCLFLLRSDSSPAGPDRGPQASGNVTVRATRTVDSSSQHPPRTGQHSALCARRRLQLDGESGALVWGEQFGSGADDQAVGLVLGPVSSAAADAVGSLEQEKGGGSPLYLTGWTRGALFSKEPGECLASAWGLGGVMKRWLYTSSFWLGFWLSSMCVRSVALLFFCPPLQGAGETRQAVCCCQQQY